MADVRGGEWEEWAGRGGREQCFPFAARALIALTFGCKTIDHDDAHCLFDREGDRESGREREEKRRRERERMRERGEGEEEEGERDGERGEVSKCNANVECECEC